jgi:hypothetical protein
MVMRDGLIVALGKNITVPRDAWSSTSQDGFFEACCGFSLWQEVVVAGHVRHRDARQYDNLAG